MEKIAIIGFTPREEVLVSKLKKQNPNSFISLYSGIPNRVLENRVDEVNGTSDADFYKLSQSKPDVVFLGPDKFSSLGIKERLTGLGIPVIGADQSQIRIETDRSYLREEYPELRDYFPPYQIVTEFNKGQLNGILKDFGSYAIKYNGVYDQIGGGTKISGIHLHSKEESLSFIQTSVRDCGKAVIEKKVEGLDFSVNAISARDGSLFFFPENYCYKLRDDGNKGPNTSGTGSFAYADRLPYLSEQNQAKAREITKHVVEAINKKSDEPLVSGLNLDFRVGTDEQVYLFEVNARFAGAGTLSTVTDLCGNNLFDILGQSLHGSFSGYGFEAQHSYAVAAFAFPHFFPGESDQPLKARIPKAESFPENINCYTGWIEVMEENADSFDAYLKNSTTLLLQAAGANPNQCRNLLYRELSKLPDTLEYRKDIGDERALRI